MIKFIASDIDGTLLQHGAKELKPRLFELIRELRECGICFAAASGRQYHSLYDLFEPVQNEISYIAENGSLCLHEGKVISKGFIDRELGLRIFKKVREYDICDCMLSCESKIYTDSKDPEFLSIIRNDLNYDIEVVDDLRNTAEDFLKIAVYDENGTKEIEAYLKEHFAGEIKIVTSGNFWVDFIAPNANKATGLAAMLSHFGITSQECVAFGDQYNDVEMLQFSGTSYAMSGAAPGISYYSTYVTDSVEEVLEDILANARLTHI